MAIRIIEGVPGSGKSYFAVHHILTKYFVYDSSISEWHRKKEYSSLVLVTNIDAFPYSLSLDSLIEAAGSQELFFSYEYQVTLTNGAPYVYLIDEAQFLFPFTYRDTRVFLFFQKHRHLGIDIYLVTQDADHLAKGMRSLAEFHIVAVRRSLSVSGELRYRFVDPQTKELWTTKVLRKDWKVYAFYKSFSGVETEKGFSVPRRYAMYGGFGLVVILLGGYFGIIRSYGGRGDHKEKVVADLSGSGPSMFGGSAAVASPGPVGGRVGGAAPSASSDSGFVTVVGSFTFGDKKGFIISVEGRSARISHNEMIVVCKCHADTVPFGSVYGVDLEQAPAAVRVLLQQVRPVTQSPAMPAVRGNM